MTEGQSVKVPDRPIGAPFMSFQPNNKTLEQFCEKWCGAGTTHHMGFAYGKCTSQIKILAGKEFQLESIQIDN